MAPRELRCVIAVDEAEVAGRPQSSPPERRGPAGDPGLGHREVTPRRLAEPGLQRNQRQQLKPAWPPAAAHLAGTPPVGELVATASQRLPSPEQQEEKKWLFFAFDSPAGGSEEHHSATSLPKQERGDEKVECAGARSCGADGSTHLQQAQRGAQGQPGSPAQHRAPGPGPPTLPPPSGCGARHSMSYGQQHL